jgi:RNA polymerase sigma-70 factor, ECF subfamily
MKSRHKSAKVRRAEFEDLYAKHSREVWAIAYARRMDSNLAMDIAQEAFMRLWKHWEAGEEEIDNPRAWLMRVARNLAEDYAKSAFRRNGTMAPETMNGVNSKALQPLELMERAEAFGRIRGTLMELPEADRQILTLKYAFDYDAAEIAEALGINYTAVHMRLSRARSRLGELLTANGTTGIP